MKRIMWKPVVLVLGIFVFMTTGEAQKFIVCNVDNAYHINGTTLWGEVYLMEYLGRNNVQVLKRFPAVYGKRGVKKTYKGDKKTPIGKYKIRGKQRTRINKRFGGWSLQLDYPNRHDRRARRSGSGIAIHGGRVNGTLGCVRILDGSQNYYRLGTYNIAQLAKSVPVGTQVIICENIDQALLTTPGNWLSMDAANYWKEQVLNQDLNRYAVQDKLQYYQGVGSFVQTNSHNPIITTTATTAITSAPKAEFASYTTPIRRNSVRANFTYGDYFPQNIQDGRSSTAWVSDLTYGIPKLDFTFAEAQTYSKLKIRIGYDKIAYRRGRKLDRWEQNSRPSTLQVHFEDGTSQIVSLADTRNTQVINFLRSHTGYSIKVEILDHKSGSKYPQHICISELSFE